MAGAQGWFEACRLRWAYHAMIRAKKERQAATLIQARARVVLAKNRARWLRLQRDRLVAALKIQSRCARTPSARSARAAAHAAPSFCRLLRCEGTPH